MGSYETVWSHLRGIKQMLKLCGGIKGYHMLKYPAITNLIILLVSPPILHAKDTHYQQVPIMGWPSAQSASFTYKNILTTI